MSMRIEARISTILTLCHAVKNRCQLERVDGFTQRKMPDQATDSKASGHARRQTSEVSGMVGITLQVNRAAVELGPFPLRNWLCCLPSLKQRRGQQVVDITSR